MSTSSSEQKERKKKETKTFKLGTFNVRGLTQDYKQEQLSRDMSNYNLDVLCIQETKIKELINIDIDNNRLICLESNSQHHGNGFMVSKKWKNNIYKFWRVNDRIAVLQLQTEKSNVTKSNNEREWRSRTTGETTLKIERSAPKREWRSQKTGETTLKIERNEPKDHLINIINVYAPTSDKVEKNENTVQSVYREVEQLLNKLKSPTSVTLIGGDFNAKIGKRTNQDGEIQCIGKFSKGTRNRSGELLIEFCEKNKLFICNSAFQHPSRHITTWSQSRTNKETNIVKHIYNQIDYILINRSYKQNLKEARSHAGTETYSDHRLVVLTYEDNWTKLYKTANRKKDSGEKKINTSRLVNEEECRKQYQEVLDQKMENTECNTWEELSDILQEVAAEVVGYKTPENKTKIEDDQIRNMSKAQKNLHLAITKESNPEKLKEMRTERKKTVKEIQRRLKMIREEKIDKIVQDIEQLKDDAKMFRAVKNMKNRKFENPTVHDKEGKNVTSPDQVYRIIEEHFKTQFRKENEPPIQRFVGEPKPLRRPITGNEIYKVVKTMSNNKAYVKIPVELIKYSTPGIYNKTATILNNIFDQHTDIDTGSADLIALQKPPPKKKGPVKNLRPINLLPVIRKILSKIGLKRSESETERHLSPTQTAYRTGRSTGEIVWTYRWLLAKVQEYNIKIYVTGIDMSSAFDTIHRYKVLEIAERILDEDGVRILRILISNTSIEIKVKGAKTKPVKTNIGAPQGDSYSGPLFTIYFENALQEVRRAVELDLEKMEMPEEMIYADDYDHLTIEERKQKQFIDKAPNILRKHNLNVNDTKTEKTILQRHKHDKKNKTTNEPWRETVKLGSKLGDREDMKNRRDLATGSMNKMEAILKTHRTVKIKKRLQLYSALVKSVLMYNCGTWGMSMKDEREMNSFHRRQLRKVLKVKYPTTMRNKAVYEQTKTKPISVDITQARWKLFGHILRMKKDTPGRLAMKYYFQKPEGVKKYRGRKRTTIITTINNDIKRTAKINSNFDIKPINSELDLRNVRVKAMNRKHWQKRVKMITDAAYSTITLN